jgi:protein phosphatase 2C family protein 2/3
VFANLPSANPLGGMGGLGGGGFRPIGGAGGLANLASILGASGISFRPVDDDSDEDGDGLDIVEDDRPFTGDQWKETGNSQSASSLSGAYIDNQALEETTKPKDVTKSRVGTHFTNRNVLTIQEESSNSRINHRVDEDGDSQMSGEESDDTTTGSAVPSNVHISGASDSASPIAPSTYSVPDKISRTTIPTQFKPAPQGDAPSAVSEVEGLMDKSEASL